MILFQVNRFLSKRRIGFFLRDLNIDQGLSKKLYPLHSRKLLKISGNESSVFLQGLITNDMHHFEEGTRSMYTMFLNNKGRVLYDTLLYKWDDDNTFMLECDKSALMLIQKHLALYKLKRRINVEDVNNELRLLVLPSACDLTDAKHTNNKVFLYKDPRLYDLGLRIIADSSMDNDEIAKTIGLDITAAKDDSEYKYLRYSLGVSEGCEDLPPGTSFPLEVNCDYLHGVSFHKGCYIGQELTARVHHTGVVRKRIMPFKFIEPINEEIPKDTIIIDSNKPKSNLGKLKGYINDCGIGLIRIKEALEAKELTVGNKKIQVMRPTWWPMEAPKEKVVNKIE